MARRTAGRPSPNFDRLLILAGGAQPVVGRWREDPEPLALRLRREPRDGLSDDEQAPDAAPAAPADLPQWLRGDPIAQHLRASGQAITKAAWLEEAYGSSNEIVLEQDKETRERVRRHFPTDPQRIIRRRWLTR